MRTKARRYQATLNSFTQPNGSDAIGITGDFEGGFVTATASLSTNVGAGGYVSAIFRVDGIPQGNSPAVWQNGANLSVVITEILRVPPGRHRISLQAGTGVSFPAGGTNAQMSVAELAA